jgi:hypothetical protein
LSDGSSYGRHDGPEERDFQHYWLGHTTPSLARTRIVLGEKTTSPEFVSIELAISTIPPR